MTTKHGEGEQTGFIWALYVKGETPITPILHLRRKLDPQGVCDRLK